MASATTNRLKGRNAIKKKPVESPLSDETSSTPLPPTEENEQNSEDTTTVVEPTDTQPELSVSQTEEPETPVEIEEKTEKEENDDDDEDEDESDADEEPKGPLTTTESTCILADMVSKLTLIHETSCRPLPFVDEHIAQQFLMCNQTNETKNSEDAGEMKTLDNCFQRFFRCETLSGENSFDCYYCRSLEQGQSKSNLFISFERLIFSVFRTCIDRSNTTNDFLSTSTDFTHFSQTIPNGSYRNISFREKLIEYPFHFSMAHTVRR